MTLAKILIKFISCYEHWQLMYAICHFQFVRYNNKVIWDENIQQITVRYITCGHKMILVILIVMYSEYIITSTQN